MNPIWGPPLSDCEPIARGRIILTFCVKMLPRHHQKQWILIIKTRGLHRLMLSLLLSRNFYISALWIGFLSAANGQRPRNCLSCSCSCFCCCCCSCSCSPFSSIPHLNKLNKYWLKLDPILCPLTCQSITLPTVLLRPWHFRVKNVFFNLAADLGPVLVDLLVFIGPIPATVWIYFALCDKL